MSIADKLLSLREKEGLTKKALVDKLGIKYSTYANYESGAREPNSEMLKLIATYYDVSIDYILGLDNVDKKVINVSSIPGILPIEKKRIPLLGDIACGKPMFANQEYESYVEVGSDVRADFAVRATGTSMLPKIHDGDIVFVREQPIVDENEVAVVIIDDEVTLKRYRRVNEELVSLIPDNPEHNAIYVNLKEKQNVRILGKAIALQRDIL